MALSQQYRCVGVLGVLAGRSLCRVIVAEISGVMVVSSCFACCIVKIRYACLVSCLPSLPFSPDGCDSVWWWFRYWEITSLAAGVGGLSLQFFCATCVFVVCGLVWRWCVIFLFLSVFLWKTFRSKIEKILVSKVAARIH